MMALTKVTYSMIEGAPVNVKDFGAAGDGVTDDAAAIQAALDFVKNIGSGAVYFPSGTYFINSKASTVDLFAAVEIDNVQNITIMGNGYSSIIQMSNTLNLHFINIDDSESVAIFGLVLTGRDPTVFGGGSRAINMRRCSSVAITNCILTNWGSYAISHQQGAAKDFIFDNLIFENIGNDCIDIKNIEFPVNPTERLVVSNILAKSWGVTGLDSPDVVVDCRMPMSVTNVRGTITRPSCRVVRVTSNDCVVSNIFGVDEDRTTARVGAERTAVVDLGDVTRCAVSNIVAKNTDIGIWLQGAATQIAIANSVLENCERGIITTGAAEHVVIANSIFESCVEGANLQNNSNISIIGCKANGCGQFLQLGTNPNLTVVGNTVSNSGTTAWNLSAGQLAENTYTFIANTVDISPATKSYLRSINNNIAFSAVSTNAAHTAYLEASTGGANVTLSAVGADTDINLTLSPKGGGRVTFGTHTVSSDSPVTGFITIRDSGGVSRRLAVID
jgi:hypothetical protein